MGKEYSLNVWWSVRTYAQAVTEGPQPLTWPLAYGLIQEAKKDLGHRNVPEETEKEAQAIAAITEGTAHDRPRTPQAQSLGCLNPFMGRWEGTNMPDEWDDEYALLYQECNPYK